MNPNPALAPPSPPTPPSPDRAAVPADTDRAAVPGDSDRTTRDARHRRIVLTLTAIAAILSLGHHVDHIIRGNHVGWPLTPEPNAFTYSLGIYPMLLVATLLYRARRIGSGSLAILSGGGALFVAAIHFGPHAIEPPRDIVHEYEHAAVGGFWFGWLILLVAVLVVTFVLESTFWAKSREQKASDAVEPPSRVENRAV